MKNIFLASAIFFFLALAAFGQTTDCPPDKVCISPEAAKSALQAQDLAKAKAEEIKVKDQAIEDLKKVIADLKQQLALTTGQLTGEQAANVQNRAIIELLLKSVRPKKFGIINF